MNLLLHPLLAASLLLASLTASMRAEANFNEVGKAMTIMLGDSHFEALGFDENLNQRILDLYLETLDPDKLYLTQGDVREFRKKYADDAANAFDILLLRSRGMEPARDIYTRFATRVAEQTEYIETLTDKAAFDFTTDTLVPLSRKRADWPFDRFAAQRIWRLRIADELLSEELLRVDPTPKKEELKTSSAPTETEAPSPQAEEPASDSPQPSSEPQKPEPEAQPSEKTAEISETVTPIIAAEETPIVKKPKAPAPSAALPVIQKEEPRKIIKKRYLRFKETVQSASDEEIADYFFSAVAQAHDPHSDYLSVKENERFDRELRNQLTGIGAELSSEPDGATRIAGIIVNGPAHRQGKLKPDDRLVAIDPLNDGKIVDITFLPIERVVQLILGRKDTPVGLIVENHAPEDNERRKVVIVRGTIQLKNAAASAEIVNIAQPEGPPRTLGWIKIPLFYLDFEDADPSVYKDVKKLVSRLKRENVDGIALDLRDNGGGSLTEVPRLAGLFLPRGPVVQAKNQRGQVEVLSSTPLKPDYEGPLIVVTDRNSASSSEILAGALQDYNRAIIVGESSTFGKGTVQEKMGVANFLRFMQDPRRAGDLKTTVQKFYRVTGSSTQLRGIIPDIIVPSINDAREIGERFLPHALPHDGIAPARDFKPGPRNALFLPIVADQSRQRIEKSPDFQYIREDLIRAEVERMRNVVTLNREKRISESKKELEQEAERNDERRKRFSEMENKDAQRFHFLRLTLEDIERTRLVTVDRERDSQAIILRAQPKAADLSATPGWPSGLDPVKREALTILDDLVDARLADAELTKLKKAVEAGTNPN
ncbi:MAG: carboxy terminal-processing peptidase [Roseibacillus sp.]